MKASALALVMVVGCYQPVAPYEPSAAERYNQECEALDRLREDYKPFFQAKIAATIDKEPEAVKRWETTKAEYENITAALEKQQIRVNEARRALAN